MTALPLRHFNVDGNASIKSAWDGPDLDAELVRLCVEHLARVQAVNDAADDQEDGPAWEAYVASRDAISQRRPATLAGMIAKARAAKREATLLDGSVVTPGSMAEAWAWDLVDDLLGLVGEA
jgi:hypothetical protein